MNQYEKLIEYIINEQDDKARELFHRIVVEKSREIYENLIDEVDMDGNEEVNELVDEIDADHEGMVEAEMDDIDDMDHEPDMHNDDMEMDTDMGMPDDEDNMGDDDSELEDRVMDLESALDELKAEFDALMADEESESEHNDGEMDPDFDHHEKTKDESLVREYVDKVAVPANAEGHTVGTGSSYSAAAGVKSAVAGKNDMGGTAGINKGGSEQAADGKPIPQPNNQYSQGKGNLPHAGQYENVPGTKTQGYAKKATAKQGEQNVNVKSPIAK